jgi:hypothetical protein
MVQAWPFTSPLNAPSPTADVLGTRPPSAAPQAHVAGASSQPDPQLLATLNNISLQQPQSTSDWFFDTDASSHMSQGSGNLSSLLPHSSSTRIIVGNGTSLPITHTGSSSIPTHSYPLSLHNVLVSPSLIKNLISVRALTRDNPITIEFDNCGFSIKDRDTKVVLLRSDSTTGDLYPLHPTPSLSTSINCIATVSADLWHQRLGHPGKESFRRLLQNFQFTCNKELSHTCHACRIGKPVRLPFSSSQHKFHWLSLLSCAFG